jgi:CRISPR-associated endonuclease/helicase Cas3
MSSADFFTKSYEILRVPYAPMEWMKRMFAQIIEGKAPSLVDLPTGAGKTELAVIWLLALAWYAQDRAKRAPVPRRLVWIVNRRVLVQQVFVIADELRARLISDKSPELETVRDGLRTISGDAAAFFRVVELRGQIVQDRDWAIRPTVPQLIIGTVDQIGSRLLFQGYGLGKWGRPQQAGLLGVDSWVAVDEAHLVPAFVLTLRQLRERCSSSADELPPPFNKIFPRLPFWLSELSATPGLPHPAEESCDRGLMCRHFRLTDEDKRDAAIADRILAFNSRRVQIQVLDQSQKSDKPKEILTKALIDAAANCKDMRVAVFVREVAMADKIDAELRKKGIAQNRICKITGRTRGYERDRLTREDAFKIFLSERSGATEERYFLIGTAAAEVGLDADADVILCDFASLPTLLQRLGRLDRRGILSRRWMDGNGEPPTMRIFAWPMKAETKRHGKPHSLAKTLKSDIEAHSAELMAGTHWLAAIEAKGDAEAETRKNDEEANEEKSTKKQVDALTELINGATWSVLDPKDGTSTPPKDWLESDLAGVAAGPVVAPPVTDAILDCWSATTDARSPHLSPHPFLYGLNEDEEGTPLVGVAFRLELEALRETATVGDTDPDRPDAATTVLEIFEKFPPLRAELHYVRLSTAREWLNSPEAEQQPLLFRKYDQWQVKLAGEPGAEAARLLGPNATIILPASRVMRKPCKKLIEDSQEVALPEPPATADRDTALCDVLDGVSKSARYCREIDPATARSGGDGAFLWDFSAEENEGSTPAAAPCDRQNWKIAFTKVLEIGGSDYRFRYLRPRKDAGLEEQYLDDHNGKSGHLSRAEAESARLAEAVAPGDVFLKTLLAAAARQHDEGKRHPKWQRAFGRRGNQPEIAKLSPAFDRPAPLHGFRHEWESLRQAAERRAPAPCDIPEDMHPLWRDLFLHLVGVHHGRLRPSLADPGLSPGIEPDKQNSLRLESAERFVRLQRLLGRWRLAYLEALLKTADAQASTTASEEEDDES